MTCQNCERLERELERASNPMEHADYFTPMLAERDERIAQLEREHVALQKALQKCVYRLEVTPVEFDATLTLEAIDEAERLLAGREEGSG